VGAAALLLALSVSVPAAAAQADADSLVLRPDPPTERLDPAYADGKSPSGALWRSLAVPGWGQLYNGRPVRAAVGFLAVAGIGTIAVQDQLEYGERRRAAQYANGQELLEADLDEPAPDNEFAGFYDDWLALNVQTASQARSLRDASRRNRDLRFILTGLVYTLQAADTFVTAHLAGFDVGEDLSVQVLPAPGGLALRATF
jgi:hypothetical protein